MAAKKDSSIAAPVVSDKKKALETAMQQIEKTYGKGSIMRYGDNVQPNVEAIPPALWRWIWRWASAAYPVAASSRSMGLSPPVRPRWLCTFWRRPRKWAARWPSWMPSTLWIPPMPVRWG